MKAKSNLYFLSLIFFVVSVISIELVTDCSEEKKVVLQGDRFSCNQCDSTFAFASGLSRHRKLHKRSIVVCDECNRVFKTNEYLKIHKRNIHSSKKKRFICGVDGCQLTFQQQSSCCRHRNAKHARYFCVSCGKGHYLKFGLKRHEKYCFSNHSKTHQLSPVAQKFSPKNSQLARTNKKCKRENKEKNLTLRQQTTENLGEEVDFFFGSLLHCSPFEKDIDQKDDDAVDREIDSFFNEIISLNNKEAVPLLIKKR